MKHPVIARSVLAVLWLGLSSALPSGRDGVPAGGHEVALGDSGPAAGSTATRLADGEWLIAGGEGAENRAALWNPVTGILTDLQPLQAPRAWHSATLLSDGTVLLAGGRSAAGLVETAEVYDPATRSFTTAALVGTTSRSFHSATLLTDGRVLVIGGSRGGSSPLPSEIWDLTTGTATVLESRGIGRLLHTATLMSDGGVLITGGSTLEGTPASEAFIVDPTTGTPAPAATPNHEQQPSVVASIPADGTTDLPLDAHFAVRFSEALSVESISADTIRLEGPSGLVSTRIVAGEGGRLAFVWPAEPLESDAAYVLTVANVVDTFGAPIVPWSAGFTTRAGDVGAKTSIPEHWVPDAGWRTNRGDSPWQQLKPLEAEPGVTALAGQILRLNGEPLPNVMLQIGRHATQSGPTGRFLLRLGDAAAGRAVLWVDGATAGRQGASYGSYEIGVSLLKGRTVSLPYTIWMPLLDTAHAVAISSPTTSETVISTPAIPGLELHLAADTVIRDHNGKPVTAVSMTPVPLDRPPFPLPAGVNVPLYFTTQPGSSTLSRGARLIYPNGLHLPPGTVMDFWRYEPDGDGWEVYGHGRVSSDGRQVVPDPGVEVYEFTGAMVATPSMAPDDGPPPGDDEGEDGDPVDLNTGLFILRHTDLRLPDVIPIALTRTYRQADSRSRAFGIGATHPYDIFFVGDTFPYTYIDLILEDGGRVHYDRTSPGTGYTDAVYQHLATPTEWYNSTIAWNGSGWTLTRQDGTVMKFRDGFQASRPTQAALLSVQDRFGNVVTLARDANANLTKITSPNGRWVSLSYDASYRVTQAQDNIGRTVVYTYDASGRLWKVTDPEGGVSEYTYDASHRMLTLKDARGTVYLTNAFDANNRVTTQTLADNTTYQFTYTTDGQGHVTQTDVTNPRGFVRRVTFNTVRYRTSDIEALGTPLERTTTIVRTAGSNFVTSVTDGLNRRTDFTYDSNGHVLTTTRLAGTADAVTTTFTYESQFGQLASTTDPLNHTWSLSYTNGRLTGISDPLGHAWPVILNSAGQVTQVTDPLQHTWQLGYTGGDLTSATDPLNHTFSRFVDSAGRVMSTTDPLGRVTQRFVDRLNRVTSVIDAAGGHTTFSYDGNSNLLSITDALNHATAWTYDLSDRVAARMDPLGHASGYQHDGNGNTAQATDRKGQVTTYEYDALDRLTRITFDDTSTIGYTYDAGDRLTQLVDSANGTITRTYDGLDRLTSETTPEGVVTYTYDADGRRATMTVAGQSPVNYSYDNAHRLTTITQDTSVVEITYDAGNRRSTLSYPNGIVATYGYDSANELSSLTYTLSGMTIGDLSYSYDAAGQRTSVGGSWARTGIPPALGSATYDAANRLVTRDGTSFWYDVNGNVTSDGTAVYTWNARDQLVAVTGGTNANFAYDGLGRRRQKTLSGVTTRFLYDGLQFVQELSAGGTPTANLLTALWIDETFLRTDATGSRVFLTDALGSPLELADAAGALQTHYTYEPFGAASVSGVASTSATQFTNRESDGPNLYFYRTRYYSAMAARFLSEDRIGFSSGQFDLYAYVLNRPTMFVDPLGFQQSGPALSGPSLWWNTFKSWLNDLIIAGGLGEDIATIADATQNVSEGKKIADEAKRVTQDYVDKRDDIDALRELCRQINYAISSCDPVDPKKHPPEPKKSKSDDRQEPDM